MAKKALSYLILPSRPIAAGAATPNPGIVGVSIWSSIETAELIWNGTLWQLSGAALSSNPPTTLAPVTSTVGTASTVSPSNHTHAHGIQNAVTHHALASSVLNGFMSSADYTKMAGVTYGATALPLTVTTTPVDVGTSAIGTSVEAAHADHVHRHGALTDGTLHALATASFAGFMSSADFTKLELVEAGATAPQTLGGGPSALALTGAAGSLSTVSRQDHTHTHNVFTDQTLHASANGTTAGFLTSSDFTKLAGITTAATATPLETTTEPQAIAATASAPGTGTTASANDHVHAHGVQSTAAHHAIATGAVPGFISAANFTKLAGISPDAQASPVALSSATPLDISLGVVGVSTLSSREDHTHAHGTQTDPTHHALATASVSGFISPSQLDKINNIDLAVLGGGTANVNKVAPLSSSGLMSDEYKPSLPSGKINLAIATAQPPLNTAISGGKIYTESAKETFLSFSPANSVPTTTIQPFLGNTKTTLSYYKADNTLLHRDEIAILIATTNAGGVTGFDTVRGRTGLYNTATGTASTSPNIRTFLGGFSNTTKGINSIFTFGIGGNVKGIVPPASSYYFIGYALSPEVMYWSGTSTINMVNGRVGFGSCPGGSGFCRNSNSGTNPTWTASSVLVNNPLHIYELKIQAPIGWTTSSGIYMRLRNVTTGAVTSTVVTGLIPAAGIDIYPVMVYQAGPSAVAQSSIILYSIMREYSTLSGGY